VAEIMRKDLITVEPDTPTLDAIVLMRTRGIGCLPVVHEGRLVGIVTESDFMGIAGELLEQKLREE
jgi:CBS domain-containing protein